MPWAVLRVSPAPPAAFSHPQRKPPRPCSCPPGGLWSRGLGVRRGPRPRSPLSPVLLTPAPAWASGRPATREEGVSNLQLEAGLRPPWVPATAPSRKHCAIPGACPARSSAAPGTVLAPLPLHPGHRSGDSPGPPFRSPMSAGARGGARVTRGGSGLPLSAAPPDSAASRKEGSRGLDQPRSPSLGRGRKGPDSHHLPSSPSRESQQLHPQKPPRTPLPAAILASTLPWLGDHGGPRTGLLASTSDCRFLAQQLEVLEKQKSDLGRPAGSVDRAGDS